MGTWLDRMRKQGIRSDSTSEVIRSVVVVIHPLSNLQNHIIEGGSVFPLQLWLSIDITGAFLHQCRKRAFKLNVKPSANLPLTFQYFICF